MNPAITTVLLLIVSNVFMYFAWYGNLKLDSMGVTKSWPLICVILLSWGIALIEYCFMIPANRIGFVERGGPFTLMQLKVMQEVITLVIFVLMSAVMFSDFKVQWNHILAMLLVIAAVYLVFMD